MKADITFHPVTGVELIITKQGEAWGIYLINKNLIELETVMVTSRGYGKLKEEQVKTSTLRHMLGTVPAQGFVFIEPLDPAVFQLTNEYWVSYYIVDQIFDKKFIFVPETITERNLSLIPELNMQGIRHT
jgi:hypothetical protein